MSTETEKKTTETTTEKPGEKVTEKTVEKTVGGAAYVFEKVKHPLGGGHHTHEKADPPAQPPGADKPPTPG